MASPFAVFRKYQAAMLAVFGVLIILVFVVGDPLSRIIGGGGSARQDPVVVQWDGNELTQNRLYSLLDMRAVVHHLLVRAQTLAIQQGAFGEDAINRLRFGLPLPEQPIISQASLTPGDTVRTLVMAEKARKDGYVVPDTEITGYLLSLVDRKLSTEQLSDLIEGREVDENGKLGPRRYSVSAVYDVLREEMLANKLFEQFYRGSLGMPMAQQLDYYARLNRRIEAEVLAIPVDAFLDKVRDPTDAELKDYFEKYKSEVQPIDFVGGTTLVSPKPGFKLPQRVAVEYVMANPDDWVEALRDEVTEEEIQAYYDKNKDTDEQLHADDDLILPEVDEDEEDNGKVEAGTDEDRDPSGTEDTKEPDNGANENAADSRREAAREDVQQLAGDEGAENAAPLDEASTEVDDATEPAEASDPAGDQRPSGKAADEAEDEGKAASDGEGDDPAESGANGDAGGGDAGGGDADGGDADGGDADGGDTDGGDTGGGDTGGGDTARGDTEGDDAKSSDTLNGEAEKRQPSYKPLDEVRDYIHQKLARQKANARVEETLAGIRSSMENYYKARIYVEEGDEPALPRPVLKAAAERERLKWQEHGLLSARAFQDDTEIGKSSKSVPGTQQNPFPPPIPFTAIAFREGEHSLFKPDETLDDEGNRYLFWKTDERGAEVPELADVRDEVVRWWKLGAGLDDVSDKARGLARRRAEELATMAQDGKPLSEFTTQQPGSNLVETESFSWLTTGSAAAFNPWQPQQPRLSPITGIDQPGREFMQAAFGLDVDDVGVAMNHPQSDVHVMRVVRENKSQDVVQANFLEEMEDRRVMGQIQAAARLDWQMVQQGWLDELDGEFNVVWLKPEVRFAR